MDNSHGSDWTICLGKRKGFVIPVGVEILLDPLGMLVIINLVENGRNIWQYPPTVCILGPCERAGASHNVAARKILPEVDDEEVGDKSSNDGSLGFCPNGTG